jgi:hypothetical protein
LISYIHDIAFFLLGLVIPGAILLFKGAKLLSKIELDMKLIKDHIRIICQKVDVDCTLGKDG